MNDNVPLKKKMAEEKFKFTKNVTENPIYFGKLLCALVPYKKKIKVNKGLCTRDIDDVLENVFKIGLSYERREYFRKFVYAHWRFLYAFLKTYNVREVVGGSTGFGTYKELGLKAKSSMCGRFQWPLWYELVDSDRESASSTDKRSRNKQCYRAEESANRGDENKLSTQENVSINNSTTHCATRLQSSSKKIALRDITLNQFDSGASKSNDSDTRSEISTFKGFTPESSPINKKRLSILKKQQKKIMLQLIRFDETGREGAKSIGSPLQSDATDTSLEEFSPLSTPVKKKEPRVPEKKKNKKRRRNKK